MNRYLFIFVLLLLETFTLQAQHLDTDSLKSRLTEASGVERANILVSLTRNLQRTNPAEAINYGTKALSVLTDFPDPELEIEAWYHRGWAYYYSSEYDSAFHHSRQLQRISQSLGNDKGTAKALLLKSRIYRQHGEYNRGIASLDSALAIAEAKGDVLLQSQILNEKGSIQRRLSNNDLALASHLEALQLQEQMGDNNEIAVTLGYIGIVHDIMGRYDEALRYHQRCLALREEMNDKRGEAAAITNIGILHQKIGNYEEALEFYHRALSVWNSLELKDELASTYNNIGALYELRENYEEALKYYQHAFAIWSEFGNTYSVSIALSNLGAIQMHLGNYTEALELQKKALHNRQDLGDRQGSTLSLIDIATVHFELGQQDSALAAAQQALSLANEVGSWPLMRDANETLSMLHEELGEYDRALAFYKDYKAAYDSLFNSQRQSVIAELQEQYRTREQQQRIELLQRAQEVQTLWLGILIGGFLLVLLVSILLYNRYHLKKRAHQTLEQLHQTEIEKAKLRTEAAEALSNYYQAENERQTQELEAARALQLSMLPDEIPEYPNATISASMETAAEVGGDYYDFDVAEDGVLTIVIGDATGHGTKAGTLVTATKSLFNLLAQEEDLGDILERCSIAIKKMQLPRLFMALALVRLRGNRMEFVGAGMPPALIYRANTQEIEIIPLKGMPLGSVSNFPYNQTAVTLAEDDVVLLSSDGFPELENENGEMLGYERMPRLLANVGEKSPEEIISYFKKMASRWINGKGLQDDMTFVVLKLGQTKLQPVPMDH